MNALVSLLLLCAQTAFAADDALFEFLSAYRPGSEEAALREYSPTEWSAKDRELVRSRLALLQERGRGLLERAAADGPISLYWVEGKALEQAEGGYRHLALTSRALPRPGYDWLTRILAHELTHSADPFERLSNSRPWIALLEPRMKAARRVLGSAGLNTIQAASMPLGQKRTDLEARIRAKSGLPSAYAAHTTEESLAEIVSFMLDKASGYTPPPEIAAFLHKHLLGPNTGAKDGAGAFYREGQRLAAERNHSAAITALSQAIALDPEFQLAYIERAESKKHMNDRAGELKDLDLALAKLPRFSRWPPYLQRRRAAAAGR